MNKDIFMGKWKQLKGSLKQKWAKVTDSDMNYVGGSFDKVIGKLQERYGVKKEKALQEFDEALQKQAGQSEQKNQFR